MHDTMPGDSSDHTRSLLRDRVRTVMEAAWVIEHAYTAPNLDIYPWQWLWDSCFHVLVWLELGEAGRAVAELRSALSAQDPSGFVPHMRYPLDQRDPQRPVELWGEHWGRRGTSSITQPPMYGHAVAELLRAGAGEVADLIEPARLGLRRLMQRRRRDRCGLLRVAHPWETGCDDSPRWDDYCPGNGFDRRRWAQHKIDLLSTVERGSQGEPLDNPAFAAAPVSFSALTAWNGLELAEVVGDDRLAALAGELAEAVDDRWDADLATWSDAGPAGAGSGRVRTADGLLGLLITRDPQRRASVEAALIDPAAYGARFGPRGVHPGEPAYNPSAYWRGPVWPHLVYLLESASSARTADRVAEAAVRGAAASGLAEHWNGETGEGGGAIPQSWAGLALLKPAAAP